MHFSLLYHIIILIPATFRSGLHSASENILLTFQLLLENQACYKTTAQALFSSYFFYTGNQKWVKFFLITC